MHSNLLKWENLYLREFGKYGNEVITKEYFRDNYLICHHMKSNSMDQSVWKPNIENGKTILEVPPSIKYHFDVVSKNYLRKNRNYSFEMKILESIKAPYLMFGVSEEGATYKQGFMGESFVYNSTFLYSMTDRANVPVVTRPRERILRNVDFGPNSLQFSTLIKSKQFEKGDVIILFVNINSDYHLETGISYNGNLSNKNVNFFFNDFLRPHLCFYIPFGFKISIRNISSREIQDFKTN